MTVQKPLFDVLAAAANMEFTLCRCPTCGRGSLWSRMCCRRVPIDTYVAFAELPVELQSEALGLVAGEAPTFTSAPPLGGQP